MMFNAKEAVEETLNKQGLDLRMGLSLGKWEPSAGGFHRSALPVPSRPRG